MKLWLFLRKNVKVVLKDGTVVLGFVQEFCDEEDNEEEIDSILVDIKNGPEFYEYFENEIESIMEV